MRYKKPDGKGLLISIIIWSIIGVIIGAILGLLMANPAGFVIGAVGGLLLGLAQAGRNAGERQKQYEETQKFVMQKVQSGVPLNAQEQSLWDSMNLK